MLARIGTQQMVRNFLSNLDNNQARLSQLQNQLSTGKRLNTPSDDPVGVGLALGIRADITAVNAWRGNIADSLEWLSATDTALGDQIEVIHKARELVLQGANSTLTNSQRQHLAAAIDQLAEQTVNVGNASLAGRYLFGGTAVDTPPFASEPPQPNGTLNTGLLIREVGQAQVFTVNVTGDRFMKPPGSTPDIFTTLRDVADAMRNDDLAYLGGDALRHMDDHLLNMNTLRGEVGAKVNRMELNRNRFDTDDVARRDTLSKIEDADLGKVVMDLSVHESVLQASLAVGARVIQPSLADFIR